MSDQLRDAARRVVEAWDLPPEVRDDTVRTSLTECINALRAALTEPGEADVKWRYYKRRGVKKPYLYRTDGVTTLVDMHDRIGWSVSCVTEDDMINEPDVYVRTDADGNRLEDK